jgi:glucoamylase
MRFATDARAALCLIVAGLLNSTAALACPPSTVAPEVAEGIELLYGATNVNAALGDGGLTAGVSRCGELTVLKWPGPSWADQLEYLTSNAADARMLPHFGALESHGAFAGVAYRLGDGTHGVTWLRDAAWERHQAYAQPGGNVLVTRSTHAGLGLDVAAYQFVLPGRDVLVNDYEVRRVRGSRVRRATLLFYANFSPTLARLPYFPVADWALDFQNDFAVGYDRRERAFLHFMPATRPRDYGALGDVLRAPPRHSRRLARAVRAALDAQTERGVYIAFGARRRDDGHQAGFDDAPTCAHQSVLAERTLQLLGLPPAFAGVARALFVCDVAVTHPGGPLGVCRDANGWTYAAESAWSDAQDGVLSGSPVAACRADTALAHRLRFRRGVARATFDVAVAGARDDAWALLRDARAGDPAAQRAETEAWWATYLAGARLPATDDATVRAFAERSLVVARTATDRASGAIVASITTQSPYGADWPRDGAFINHALDLAGFHDVVSRHNRFYARVQRRAPSGWSPFFGFPPCNPAAPTYPSCIPAGTFEMNYYADSEAAVPAGPISFEIDNAGLVVWTLWDHARFLDGAARADYLADVCPAIARGATGIAGCRDPDTGLQCAANEDDNLPLTQGLQGAETALLALRAAVDASDACGIDGDVTTGWAARAAELETALLARFVVPGPPPHLEGARAAWSLWPLGVVPPDDALAAGQASYLAQSLERTLRREPLRTGYDSEPLLARAKWMRAIGDEAGLATAREQVRQLIRLMTTPDTMHMGEFALRVQADLDGDGVAPDYQPANAVPHVWAHMYLYAAAMEAFGY